MESRLSFTSTIVEIIEAYQPCTYGTKRRYIYNSRNYRSILAFISSQTRKILIYNSRNYRSILAQYCFASSNVYLQQQKLQKHTSLWCFLRQSYQSTIVEIIEAYQPWMEANGDITKSTIVEIIEAYQPFFPSPLLYAIYNSRNYRSILARQMRSRSYSYLQQQKLQKHTSLLPQR